VRVTGPLGDPVDADYGLTPDSLAIVEMAQASGLALVTRNDPLRASTRGTGELLAAAARTGARRAVVGVGGSATTDGGLGALDALDWSSGARRDRRLRCADPFLEAATRFGPQKGASDAQIALLTRRLERLALEYERRNRRRRDHIEGAGAAGGLAGGLAALAPGSSPASRSSPRRRGSPRRSTARTWW